MPDEAHPDWLAAHSVPGGNGPGPRPPRQGAVRGDAHLSGLYLILAHMDLHTRLRRVAAASVEENDQSHELQCH